MIAARAALPAGLRAAHSAAIETALASLLLDGRGNSAMTAVPLVPQGFPAVTPSTFSFYWPHQGEFDARPLATRLLAAGWNACLPVVIAPTAPLAFRAWTPATPLAPDRYGIPTPIVGPELQSEVSPDVLLIPLVVFDAANYRIGYGGGFFDRTLAALAVGTKPARSKPAGPPLAIGIGFELARVADTLPGPFDIPLDIIVTEAGVAFRGNWRDHGISLAGTLP